MQPGWSRLGTSVELSFAGTCMSEQTGRDNFLELGWSVSRYQSLLNVSWNTLSCLKDWSETRRDIAFLWLQIHRMHVNSHFGSILTYSFTLVDMPGVSLSRALMKECEEWAIEAQLVVTRMQLCQQGGREGGIPKGACNGFYRPSLRECCAMMR